MSRRKLSRVMAAVAVVLAPMAAAAAEEDVLRRIEALSREIEQLKAQVRATEDKAAKSQADVQAQARRSEERSLERWLTVGGDYRFRVDSLRGETRPFTDVGATFANAQNRLQGDFFANPSGASAYFGAPQAGGMSTAGALSGLMAFAQGMNAVRTYNDALAFLGAPRNAGMAQGIGAFAAQVPAHKPKNDTLYTNRLRLDLHAKATQDVSVTTRLAMYKTFGAQDDAAVVNGGAAPFFADRVGVFDGTVGHLPSSGQVSVDRAYGTWSNIGGRDLWFSVGRRPSTNGAPGNLKLNEPRPGNGGTPSLLVDYAFDGMTLGYAPDIDNLPGAYGKICYGRGFESGLRRTPANSIADTDMLGISLVPIDSDKLRVWAQWNRGFHIFDAPAMNGTYFGTTAPKADLGDIDWFGVGAMSTLKNVGPGNLNFFGDVALSVTRPNQNVSAAFGFQGLLTGGFLAPEAASRKRGNAIAVGLRYDLPSRTKIGLEFNRGSKNWITFAPAADDIWTAKAGTRGDVWEAYLIQELAGKPISSFGSKAFFKLGAQYYDFKYTGSNNWVGAPVRISDMNGQFSALTPLRKAWDIYGTFEVKF
ncbi:DUF3373 family protein [Ramlibacter sp.]|uniref:DUF3373 family protein n=1 Tax=Ramlibacter sp. TaxID=1917967 RepID=UPI002B913D93|nr:DUF3373 family protein [Ramlibacter sp.]HWI82310.1 DUF3373 family protein [Ramlibacter sp.]